MKIIFVLGTNVQRALAVVVLQPDPIQSTAQGIARIAMLVGVISNAESKRLIRVDQGDHKLDSTMTPREY